MYCSICKYGVVCLCVLPDRRLELFFSGRNNNRAPARQTTRTFFFSRNNHRAPKPKPVSRQNQKLTQQHNWKKGSSSPREAWAGSSSPREESVFIFGREWQIPNLRAFAFFLHRNKYRWGIFQVKSSMYRHSPVFPFIFLLTSGMWPEEDYFCDGPSPTPWLYPSKM